MEYLSAPTSWIMLVLGLMIGSFLNVCIYRIPEGSFWKNLRSHCRYCKSPIPFYFNIPVLSYLILRGKTGCCSRRLPVHYPIIELATGLLFVYLYWVFPFWEVYDNRWIVNHSALLQFVHAAFFSCFLLVCTVIDIKHLIIPDVLNIPMILLAPLAAWVHPELSVKNSVLGIILGGFLLYAVAWLYWILRKQIGIGFGDVKFLAAIGGWLGYQAIFPTIFVASLVGTFVGLMAIIFVKQYSFKSAIPFGPFLALGAFMHLALGKELIRFFL